MMQNEQKSLRRAARLTLPLFAAMTLAGVIALEKTGQPHWQSVLTALPFVCLLLVALLPRLARPLVFIALGAVVLFALWAAIEATGQLDWVLVTISKPNKQW
jgi:hypothetical protein